MTFQAIRGTKDIFGEEAGYFQILESTAHRLFQVYGYEELRTPAFEQTELFVHSIGPGSDIVKKEMYTFADRKGRSLTLRPEATAPVVRALIEHKLYKISPVWKFYYMGPMFRYERPQKGRYRQFHQIGVEFFGVPEPVADGEIISLFHRYLTELGFVGFKTKINSVGCKDCRPSCSKALINFLKEIETELCPDCRIRAEANPLRVFDCKNQACQQVLKSAPLISKYLCDSCKQHFAELVVILQDFKVNYEIDSSLVRGFDYYTRTVFETLLPGLGAQDAAVGGGRYDNLVEQFGGPSLPGVGASFGTERLILAMKANKVVLPSQERLYFYAISLDNDCITRLARFVEGIRAKGVSVQFDCQSRSLKSGLRAAGNSGARFALILGPDEMQSKKLLIKDLDSGQQLNLNFSDIENFVNQLKAKS